MACSYAFRNCAPLLNNCPYYIEKKILIRHGTSIDDMVKNTIATHILSVSINFFPNSHAEKFPTLMCEALLVEIWKLMFSCFHSPEWWFSLIYNYHVSLHYANVLYFLIYPSHAVKILVRNGKLRQRKKNAMRKG